MTTSHGTAATAARTRAPGDRSRARIVHDAARLATVEGLEGLSLGRLAQVSGVPKSSVHALFGSKEALQLATVAAARDSFVDEVVAPAYQGPASARERLLALCEGYLSYVERRVFPGGCFFVAASAEIGAQAGHLHDEVARVQREWGDLLLTEASRAAVNEELPRGTDPAQLAFELGAMLAGTNIVCVLHDDNTPLARARAALRRQLGFPESPGKATRST